MIHYLTPFCPEKRLGHIHNYYCSLVPNDDDWICLMDPDVMFLEPDTPAHIAETIEQKGAEWDVLGCMTNRIGVQDQLAKSFYSECIGTTRKQTVHLIQEEGDMLNESNISNHISHAGMQLVRYGNEIIATNLVAGFLMLFKKSLWNKIKFQEGINFDIKFCEAVKAQGGRIGIMKGIYVLHLYRWGHDNPKQYKKHLL